MKKYGLAFGLLFVSVMSFAQFRDTQSSPYEDAIEFVYREGIVQGYGDGSFGPDRNINRAEFTKIIIGAQFAKDQIESCRSSHFTDVPQNAWFAPYVCVARQNNIIQGYNDETFAPAKNIAFVEAAKILSKTFGLPSTQSQPWYRPFVETLGNQKAIPLSIEKFDQSLNRAEMAEMVYRLKNSLTGKDSQNYASLSGENNIPADTSVNSDKVSYLDYTPAQFAKYHKKNPIVLSFYADWCPSCRGLEKEILKAQKILPSDAVILKVDYDNEKTLKQKYGIITQHTGVFINRDGSIAETVIGFSLEDIRQFLLTQ